MMPRKNYFCTTTMAWFYLSSSNRKLLQHQSLRNSDHIVPNLLHAGKKEVGDKEGPQFLLWNTLLNLEVVQLVDAHNGVVPNLCHDIIKVGRHDKVVLPQPVAEGHNPLAIGPSLLIQKLEIDWSPKV